MSVFNTQESGRSNAHGVPQSKVKARRSRLADMNDFTIYEDPLTAPANDVHHGTNQVGTTDISSTLVLQKFGVSNRATQSVQLIRDSNSPLPRLVSSYRRPKPGGNTAPLTSQRRGVALSARKDIQIDNSAVKSYVASGTRALSIAPKRIALQPRPNVESNVCHTGVVHYSDGKENMPPEGDTHERKTAHRKPSVEHAAPSMSKIRLKEDVKIRPQACSTAPPVKLNRATAHLGHSLKSPVRTEINGRLNGQHTTVHGTTAATTGSILMLDVPTSTVVTRDKTQTNERTDLRMTAAQLYLQPTIVVLMINIAKDAITSAVEAQSERGLDKSSSGLSQAYGSHAGVA